MALDAAQMASDIADKIIAVNAKASKPQLVTYWGPICEGIIDHFTSQGVILPGTFVDADERPIEGTGVIS